ncbi:MAG: hypothetical protein R6X02_16570 [Enhygromyxa sp.]
MDVQYNVIATFDSSTKAEAAVDHLFKQGFETGEIAVLVADRARGRHFAIDAKHKFPQGAALGGVIGGVVGALAVGITAALGVMLPGLEGISTTTVIAAFAGAGAGGLLGWLIGGLVGLAFDEHEAKLVDGEARDGHIALGVRAEQPGKAETAERILEHDGATSVAS